MLWKRLVQEIPPDMGSFAIDFHGAKLKEVEEFLRQVGLSRPDFAEVARYTRLGKYAGWVNHCERSIAYESDDPVVQKVKVFDFDDAVEICCGSFEEFTKIPLEEVLFVE